MYTAQQLTGQLEEMGIDPKGTLLVHSSMKAVGEVDGRADTVLDVLCAYMREGLLVLPTHTWKQMDSDYTTFEVAKEPSCVGVLSNLFRQRPGVYRSYHPTHSVAAIGKEAAAFTAGEQLRHTPCPRKGCWGKLYDRKASILFIGCRLTCNTFLHGVEEWCRIPNRLAKTAQDFFVIAPSGEKYCVPQYRHFTDNPKVEPSAHYDKMERIFAETGAIRFGKFGDASCILGDAVQMADITAAFLRRDPHLFDDDSPVLPWEDWESQVRPGAL